jgi:hypothetical protein
VSSHQNKGKPANRKMDFIVANRAKKSFPRSTGESKMPRWERIIVILLALSVMSLAMYVLVLAQRLDGLRYRADLRHLRVQQIDLVNLDGDRTGTITGGTSSNGARISFGGPSTKLGHHLSLEIVGHGPCLSMMRADYGPGLTLGTLGAPMGLNINAGLRDHGFDGIYFEARPTPDDAGRYYHVQLPVSPVIAEAKANESNNPSHHTTGSSAEAQLPASGER